MEHQRLINFLPHHDHSSDCESSVTGPIEGDQSSRGFPHDNLIELDEEDVIFQNIKHRFQSNLGNKTTVVGVHWKNWLGFRVGQARLRCFGVLAHAFADDINGDISTVVKYGWYGGTKEDISRIMSRGFDHRDIRVHESPKLCLSPIEFPALSMQNCVVDEDGHMHLLLCRVLLENSYLDSRRKYTVRSANMNTHILPEYVLSFTAPDPYSMMMEFSTARNVVKRLPNSPWMPIPILISALSQFLPPRMINLIKKRYKDLRGRKITRGELVQEVRKLTGDDLLIAVIKSFQAKISSNGMI